MTEQNSNQTGNALLQEIENAVNSLRFGSIEITVHEGRVTQIEKREKVRFANEQSKSTPTANRSGLKNKNNSSY
jgi:hypothetical protein